MLTMLLLLLTICASTKGLLYPQRSSTRDHRDLGDLWDFVREPSNSIGWGLRNRWDARDISLFPNATKLPVSCSFNDVTQSRDLQDHVGWVWYQRKFYPPVGWISPNRRIFVRFEGVQYFASVWMNGEHVTNHTGGHLPFQAEVTLRNGLNTLTVAVNNTLSHHTIPSGEFVYEKGQEWYPDGLFSQKLDFGFTNYAGINRPVHLLLLPGAYISDITVVANYTGHYQGELRWNVATGGEEDESSSEEGPVISIQLLDGQKDGDAGDVYELEIGFRSIRLTETAILINGHRFYCHGFGMHEDADIRGRGFDWALMTKDLNALEWLGANCFRTSHYPYSEPRYAEADRRGIAVIAETPAVGARYFTKANLKLHSQILLELIARDKNHPSVIAWDLANEADTTATAARPYFKTLVDLAHATDPNRPVTAVLNTIYTTTSADKIADLLDFICVNRYEGWYTYTGHLDLVSPALAAYLRGWSDTFKRPVILTEYGAASIPDLNTSPGLMYSDEYQAELLAQSHKALDALRAERNVGLAGEMVWNFADFSMDQGIGWVQGCRKGVLKRNRQPKMAAYLIRKRYHGLNK